MQYLFNSLFTGLYPTDRGVSTFNMNKISNSVSLILPAAAAVQWYRRAKIVLRYNQKSTEGLLPKTGSALTLPTAWAKKVATKKFSAVFSLRLVISVKFCQFVANLYPHMLTKMALTFLGVRIGFFHFKFRVHDVTLPWLHRQWWVARPLIHRIIRFRLRGNEWWSLITSCNWSRNATEAKSSFRV